MFNKKEDIEICSFLTSTIAWGQRKNYYKKLIQNDGVGGQHSI